MPELTDGDKRPEGIFIPYDKLLQQQSDKLDQILRELRGKVDQAVFDAFRTTYEQRHESLRDVVQAQGFERQGAARVLREIRAWIIAAIAIITVVVLVANNVFH